MNAVSELVEAVVAHGADLRVEGLKLVYTAPTPLPDELLDMLRGRKRELLDHLTGGRGCVEVATPPQEWIRGLATMADMPAPLDWPTHIWPGTVEAAGVFLERWSATAVSLGWTTADLFGAHDKAPYRRSDHMGLALSMWARFVAVLLPDRAIIWHDGSKLTYSRKSLAAGAVPIWALRECAG